MTLLQRFRTPTPLRGLSTSIEFGARADELSIRIAETTADVVAIDPDAVHPVVAELGHSAEDATDTAHHDATESQVHENSVSSAESSEFFGAANADE